MLKTYSVATYIAAHGTPYMVIIVKPENDSHSWVIQVRNNGDHGGLMRLIPNADLADYRNADLLA
jgi:hypothetical protein